MNEKRFLSLLSDTTFKYLCKSKNGRRGVNRIIKYSTGIDIEDYELVDKEFNSGNNYKSYKTDIIFYNKNSNTIINVEMNQFPSNITSYRNFEYICKLVGEMFHKGEKITKYKIIQVNMNNSYCKYNKDINNLTFMLRDKKYDIELDIIRIIEIYIPSYKGICYNGVNEEEMYLSMFNATSYKELKDIISSNKEALLIMSELEILAENSDVIGLYDYEKDQKRLGRSLREEGFEEGKSLGKIEGLEEGRNLGIEEGKKDERNNIIINMLDNGMSVDEIVNYTNIPIEDIELCIKKEIDDE